MCSTTTNDLGLTDKNGACACSTDGHAKMGAAAVSDPAAVEYLVSGMTCSHCVASVTEELSAIDGVESVSVALNAGGISTVTVASSHPLDEDTVRAAVDEAGYALVTA